MLKVQRRARKKWFVAKVIDSAIGAPAGPFVENRVYLSIALYRVPGTAGIGRCPVEQWKEDEFSFITTPRSITDFGFRRRTRTRTATNVSI